MRATGLVRLSALVLVLVGVAIVILLLSGSLRVASPIESMKVQAHELRLGADVVVVEESESFDRFCFLQCVETRVRLEYVFGASVDIGVLCAGLESRVEEWAGKEPRDDLGHFVDEIAICAAATAGVSGHPSWCAQVIVYNDVGRSRHDADASVQLLDAC